MDSMKEADGVFVMDTGSEDDTVAKLRARGAVVTVKEVKPWRFDTARNMSLDLVPENTDICVCTDLDERFEPGWRKILEAAWQPDADRVLYTYNWSLKPDGTPDTQLVYFKIHSRHNYRWRYPIHEFLEYMGKKPEKSIYLENLVLNHYPDQNKSRGSYLPMLETAAEEAPDDVRLAYYLGREYMYANRWNDCIETLQRHLKLPGSFWAEERCASCRWIAKSYLMLGDPGSADMWYFKAMAECPGMREPYVERARMAYDYNDWPAVYYFALRALLITQKNQTFVNEGYAWDYTAEDLAGLACWQLGMKEEALEHAKKALEMAPEEERLKKNVGIMSAGETF
jgi:tetratricopeptide (TPR) repeat protein